MEKPIVVDIGSFSTKIGIAGDPKPLEQRTVCVKQMIEEKESTESINIYYGNRGIDVINNKCKSIMDTDISISSGNIINYLQDIIFENNNLSNTSIPSNHRLLITDHISNDKSHRSLLSELLFEQFSTPSIYFEICGVLGLYATGRLNGLIVDMGYSQTSFIPIVNGYYIDYAAKKINFGGRDFDIYFNHLLRKSGITLHTNYQLEIVRNIKESTAQCKLQNAYEKLQDDEEMNCSKYEMPDGTILQIGNARYRSCELLFGPQLIGKQYNGIHDEILNCINDCDLSLRKKLMSNITLIGGTSLLKGFGKRLINELVSNDYNRYNYHLLIAKNSKDKDNTDRASTAYSTTTTTTTATTTSNTATNSSSLPTLPSKPQKINKKTGIRIYAPINRNYSAWIGGSILCSIDSFNDNMWINHKQYQECGKSILYRQ